MSSDLEKSLRADVESYISGRLSSLQEEVARLQSQFNEAFTRLLERMDGAAQTDASVAVAISDHLRNARNEGIEAAAEGSSRARASSDIALIKAAVDELEAQHTQADILNALVNRAAAFAPRIAFFVVKGDRATGWRARGLEGTVGDDAVREISLALSSDTLLSEVARARAPWSGSPGSHAEDKTIYGRFGEEPPQRIVAVPMIARDRTVAVLYADSAGLDSDAVNLEALETLVRVAAMSVELLAARRGGAPAEAPRAAAPAPRPQAETSAAASPAFEAATPPAQEVEAAPAVEASAAAAEQPRAEEWAGSADVHEAPAAAEPPPPAATPEVTPLGASRRYGASDTDFPVEVSEEEKRYHNEARRFARLLISEIKLYNEQKVREGRDAGDIYNRLREDIDRSRQMYDKRVRPEVSSRYDYFHHELVNMLAEGDSSRLGEGYPGASATHA